jgi:putative ABC transport system substrate-binding protein
MNRRDFISLLGGSAAAAWPLAAGAQQTERLRRIGVMMPYTSTDPYGQTRRTALEQDLAGLGWTLGSNLAIDYRWEMVNVAQSQTGAAELLELKPDVILAFGTPPLQALQALTRSVPVVFTLVSLAVAQGFVESISRPGGNITGFSYLEPPVAAKWLELLKEMAPGVTRIAYIFNLPSSPYAGLFYGSIEPIAPKFAVQTTAIAVNEPDDFEPVISKLARQPGGGLIIDPDGFTANHHRLIIDLAARYRLPAIYSRHHFADDGGLLVYGVDDADHFRQVAGYLNRILRGAKPAELPVQGPTKFELVINLKAAKAIGLKVPPLLLSRADAVIE